MGRPSRPAASIDRASYELGKKVFAGEFVANAQPAKQAQQSALLSELQDRLPTRVRTRVDLPSYAGQLSDEQIEALQYFLQRRYKVKLDG